ncbi:MAG: FG-GAP-like repeat-containing protein [Bryobacteraceae bacterium]
MTLSLLSRSFAVLALFAVTACSRRAGLPKPDSPQYRELVSAFYVGLSGLETGEDVRAKTKLTQATQIAPGEPAAWADLGLLAVRQQEFDIAYTDVEKARSLAPDNSRIEALLGLIESKRGKLPEAIAHLEKAVQLDAGNLKALYALAQETERQANSGSDADAEKLLARILQKQPLNIAVLLDVVRLSAKLGDTARLQKAVAALAGESSTWPEEVRQRMAAVQQAASGGNPKSAALQVAFLRNMLARVPAYRQDLDTVKTPAVFVGEPFRTFLKLPTPGSEPAPADLATRFDVKPLPGAPSSDVSWVGSVALDPAGKPAILWADRTGVQISGGARLPYSGPLGRNGVLGADLNYDFKTDLVLAGSKGVRIYQQGDGGKFSDVTSRTHLPAAITTASYSGAWAFDVDLDGDLDILLGVPGSEPVVLRNNADGTFATVRPFAGVNGLSAFASADIDGDGDPDAALVDQDGRLHVFANERLGQFRARTLPADLNSGRFLALTAADLNGDSLPDFLLLRQDGAVLRLSDKQFDQGWELAEVVKSGAGGKAAPNLVVADLDNNGALDLIVGDDRIYMGDGRAFTPLAAKLEIIGPGVADVDEDGRLALIGLSAGGAPVELINSGTKHYHWQVIHTRAAKANGDQRINSYGIGGEIEIRSGLLTQKQIINSPLLHFGLGDHNQTDVARIVWPNGFIQAEFELPSNQTVLAAQRLKGSCPWLFAWDGKRMIFVKDGAPWSPALGLHINAQVVAGIYQTQEWFKIPGNQLVPHDGYYDLRVTAELWETYYIDHYSLMVVDHPEGTEIFSDERFAVPPPPLKIYTTNEPKPFACARDDNGSDVTAIVRDLDEHYLDTFGRGRYQGVTRDHWLELDLPDDAPRSGPLYLLGHGWMHPTDATTNIALGQNSDPPPQGLSIEVPDSQGKWTVVRKGLGFPAGKMKTVVLDLTGLFRGGGPRKLRLRTNLEIYWDKLEWAAGAQDRNRIQQLPLSAAELRYRGFSVVKAPNDSSPEVPDYNRIEGTAQKWRDLQGYCTRFGDIRELLARIDDRIVITNAGDEIRLRFAEQPAPPAGWKRDYVMVGDGWIKDGDYNSVFSKTVLPLPYHGLKDYTAPPGRLEDDPAYRKHPGDWEEYHTRYVTPEYFVKALRN